ARCT
ncbi:hypothetical protein LDE61_18100, partial [Mycobacterium tuberculosis]